MVKLLLKYATSKNIDLNARDRYGSGFDAACRGEHIDVVKEILEISKTLQIHISANFKNRSKSGIITDGLLWAIMNGKTIVAKTILQHPQGQLIHIPNNNEIKERLEQYKDKDNGELRDLIHQKWRNQKRKRKLK